MVKSSLLALDTPTALRRKLFGRSVVFHLREGGQVFAQALEGFDFVQSLQQVENKILVNLDDPEAHNPQLIRALVEAGADIQFVGELRRRLEDVYLQLVKS